MSLSRSLAVYAQFSLYPLVAFAVVAISALMTALGRRAVRSRLAAAPVSGCSRSLGLLGACLVIGAVGWLWICGLGIAVFGAGSVTASAPLLGVGLVGADGETHHGIFDISFLSQIPNSLNFLLQLRYLF